MAALSEAPGRRSASNMQKLLKKEDFGTTNKIRKRASINPSAIL